MVAGVIGRRKFIYDLWEDAVNIASRMQSNGVGGKFQVAESIHQLLKDDFICEPRGTIPIKGRSHMLTWYLEVVRPGLAYITAIPSLPCFDTSETI